MKTRRVSLSEATKAVLQHVSKEPSTIEELASSLQINRRTVTKVLSLIEYVQRFEEKAALEVVDVNSRKRLVKRVPREQNFSSLPVSIQKSLIQLAFPHPSKDEEILSRLYLARAFNQETAVSLQPDRFLRKLTRQGQVANARYRRFYLSEEGKVVAEGALRLFPELLSSPSEPGEEFTSGTFRRLQNTSNLSKFQISVQTLVPERMISKAPLSLSIKACEHLGQVGIPATSRR